MTYFERRLARYLDEAVSPANVEKIKHGMAKSGKPFKPGTFGVEIEYRCPLLEPDDEEIFEKLRDELYRNEELRSQYDEKNPEPEAPLRPPKPVRMPTETDDQWRDRAHDWNERHKQWSKEYEDHTNKWSMWQRGWVNFLHKHIDNLIETDEWRDIVEVPKTYDVQSEVEQLIDKLEALGVKVQEGDAEPFQGIWGIGPDEEGVVELRTPALKTEDIPTLTKVLGFIPIDQVDGNTSAHVHVGLSDDTDAFDLLAITTLADEESIKKVAGRNRNFDRYAKPNDRLQHKVYHSISSLLGHKNHRDNYVIDYDDLYDAIRGIGRHWGVNLSAHMKHGTVEFRYLSAEILYDIPAFLSWIGYYLLLPRIARTRKTITIKNDDGTKMYLTRIGGNQIEVSFDKVRESPLPPDELRSGKLRSDRMTQAVVVNQLVGLAKYPIKARKRKTDDGISIIFSKYGRDFSTATILSNGVTLNGRIGGDFVRKFPLTKIKMLDLKHYLEALSENISD